MKRFFATILSFLLVYSCYSQSEKDQLHLITEKHNKGVDLLQKGRYHESFPLLYSAWEFYHENLPLVQDSNMLPNDEIVNGFILGYATVCHSLGQNYVFLGDYEKAEELYRSALDVTKDHYADSSSYRLILADVGWMYFRLHNYDKAIDYYNQAKFLFEKNLDFGESYANLLSNLALYWRWTGDNLWAKMLVDMARQLFLDSGRERGLSVLLDNIASTYNDLGFTDEAIETIGQAIEIKRQEEDTNGLAVLYNNQGVIYLNQKKYKEAYESFQKASDLYNDSLDPTLFMNLALTQYLLKDPGCIQTTQIFSGKIISDVVDKFTYLSNSERELYWASNNERLSLANAMIINSNETDYSDIVYNNALFSRGLLLKTSNHIKNEIIQSGDKTNISILNRLTELNKELENTNLTVEQVDAINDSIVFYDRQLTRVSASYKSFKQELSPDWKNIQKNLKKNEAAIEFMQVPIIGRDSIPDSLFYRYYALVVKQKIDHPIIIPLCEESTLSEIISNKSHIRLDRYISNLYTSGNPRTTSGEKLYNSVWEPLESSLEGITTIYYSPAGLLYSISFDALMKDSVTLGDKYSMHLLSSTSEVPHIKKTNYRITNASVYGGIKYDVPQEQMIAEAINYEKNDSNSIFYIESDSIRSGWKYLPETETEAINIESILAKEGVSTSIYTGIKANEESIKSLSGDSPSLMHIATHGFFLSDPKEIALNPFLQLQEQNRVQNLLLRSGLLFSGANKAWVNGERVQGIDDGILTAEEISKLDLTNTQTVVLSACETGLGEVISTEGVFGLQRAFKLSGVNSLVMSLWKVPDEATSKLMIAFYNYWMSGMEIHQAFKKAQQEIRKEYPSPYNWAGFVILD